MSQWHYADRYRQQHGPVAGSELARLFRNGLLDLRSLVWREGLPGWQALGDFAGELGLLDAPAAQASAASGLALEPMSAPEPGRAGYAEAAPASPYAAPAAALRADEDYHAGGEVVQAGFWKRVAAYFIDAFVIGAASQIVQMVLMFGFFGLNAGASDAEINPFSSATGIVFILLVYLVPLGMQAFYFAAFHASARQATLGKMAVGIKVVDDSGHRISLARGIGRYFAYVLSGLLLGVGFLMVAFTQRKQGLHDLICGTQVVDKWAYSAHPEWQRRELGTVTVVILVIAGALMVLGVAFFGVLMAMLASGGH